MDSNKFLNAKTNLMLVQVSLIFTPLVIAPVLANSAATQTAPQPALSATSMAVGTVVGTPVAILRKTGSQYVGCLKEFKKDSNSYKFWGAGYSALVAAVAGPIKGTICGPKNAIKYSINKPFGKDTFSLGNLEGTPKQAKTKLHFDPDKPETQPWGTTK